MYLQFRFVTPDAIFIESGCLLKNTKYINITDVKHAINNANGMHPSARDIKEEKTIGQSRGNGNMYSQSNYLTSQEQQKPVGSSQASKAINVPIQAPVAN